MTWIAFSPIAIIMAVAVAYLLRRLLSVWMSYRLRLAVLEKLERQPDLVRAVGDLPTFLDKVSETESPGVRPDLGITGAALALFGVAGMAAAYYAGAGKWAVAAFLAGVCCILIGFLLAVAGAAVKLLSRSARG